MSDGVDMETGIVVMDLAAGGVGWALDEHNEALISEEMRTAVAAAEASIISGALAVHDYMSDSSCPVSVD
jgi:basic membrane protein A